MKKNNLFVILCGAFCSALIISNILAFKTFTLFNFVLPTAVILFPIVYITNDILAEIFGFEKAKMVIKTGFFMNIIAVISYNIAIVLPAPVFFEGQEAFEMVLSNTFRVLIASMVAYLIGNITNAKIMELMKNKSNLFSRCILSALIGEGLDAFIFISIAFFGTMSISSLIVMIFAQAIFKTVYEIVCFPLTNILVKKARLLNDTERRTSKMF
jgi:queuosine precursor transporter